MKTPLERIRLGAFFLVAVVILAVLGYCLAGYKVWEAIWVVVITLSSVGFAEKSKQPFEVQLLTIGLIIFQRLLGSSKSILRNTFVNAGYTLRRAEGGLSAGDLNRKVF